MTEDQNQEQETPAEDNAIVKIHFDINMDKLDEAIEAAGDAIDDLVYFKMQLAFIKANREKKAADAAFIRYCNTGKFE